MKVDLGAASRAGRSAKWTEGPQRAKLSLRHFYQDADWLAVGVAPPDEILTLNDGGDGTVSVHIHDSSIDLRLAGIKVLCKQIRRFDIYEDVASDRLDGRGSIENALVTLGQRLPRNGAIFLEAVLVGSNLHTALEMRTGKLAQSFYILPWATTRVARLRWPGTVEQYLKSLSRTTRKDLKRSNAKFMDDAVKSPVMKSFATPAEVDAFMNDAISVSSTTYQRRLLNRGLMPGSKEEAQIRFAAPRGGFLGHVLYANNVPVAFQYGLIYNGTYFCEHTGYDPRWAARQPGAVLFIQALLDIERRKAEIKVLDFGQGLNMFKERTTNEHHAIVHYYLFNRTLSGFLLYRTAKAMTRTVKLLSTALDMLRLRETVRELMRRWTGHGHMN